MSSAKRVHSHCFDVVECQDFVEFAGTLPSLRRCSREHFHFTALRTDGCKCLLLRFADGVLAVCTARTKSRRSGGLRPGGRHSQTVKTLSSAGTSPGLRPVGLHRQDFVPADNIVEPPGQSPGREVEERCGELFSPVHFSASALCTDGRRVLLFEVQMVSWWMSAKKRCGEVADFF
jgi:hypothetical protein